MDDALAWQGKINFAAMSKGCSIVENVVQALRKGSILDGANAEELLSQLRNWIQSLPEAVRRFTFRETSTVGPEDRHELIGSVHVSCLYYFAVILVTRPFLIEYLISRLRGRAIDFLIDDSEELSDVRIKNIKISQLAHVCVSSAAYMAETLQRIKAAEFKFGNLCLIKYVASRHLTATTMLIEFKIVGFWFRPRSRILKVRWRATTRYRQCIQRVL